ncbi:MAG TPA: YebC/PmpR family DNA-binding transcriptional regulator [Chloroflexota bacterium]
MSGHSKWAQIKRAKGATDAKRGQLFTKLSREITVAAREGADPAGNARLRLAVQRARDANMPIDNIDRAIKRGSGSGDAANYHEMWYEGYGPGGVALLVEVLTDNRNRTAAEVRSVFNRSGGNLGESGSVRWLFDSKGVITVDATDGGADDIALAAIDAGADDVQVIDHTLEIYTEPTALESVRATLEQNGVSVVSSDSLLVPKTSMQVEDKTAEQTLRLVDRLEELDDVQNVYSNLDVSDEVAAALAG